MENNNHSSSQQDTNNNQFVISYELLSLLQWMIKHDTEKFKKMISKALKSGLKHEIQRADYYKNPMHSSDMAQYSVLEFFSMLETLMFETMNEQAVESATEKNLMPAIDHIDSNACDDATLQVSIQRATAKLENNPHENPQDRLFKELLRHWKPSKKSALN